MRGSQVLSLAVAASVFLVASSRAADIMIRESGTGLATVEVPAGQTPTLSFDVLLDLGGLNISDPNTFTAYAVSVIWDGAAIVGGTDPFLSNFVGSSVLFPGFDFPLGPLAQSASTMGVAGTYESFGGADFPVGPAPPGPTATIATLTVKLLPGTVQGDSTSITPYFEPPDGLSGGGGFIPTAFSGATITVTAPTPVPALGATGKVLLALALAGAAALAIRRSTPAAA